MTRIVWSALCLLTIITAAMALTGLLWTLSPILQGLALVPGLLVTLLLVVASYADSQHSSDGR